MKTKQVKNQTEIETKQVKNQTEIKTRPVKNSFKVAWRTGFEIRLVKCDFSGNILKQK